MDVDIVVGMAVDMAAGMVADTVAGKVVDMVVGYSCYNHFDLRFSIPLLDHMAGDTEVPPSIAVVFDRKHPYRVDSFGIERI